VAFELRNKDIRDQYELLNILDSKASALFSFNAIFLAVIAIWLAYIPFNVLHLVLDIVFIGLLISCSALLSVIWLEWTPLDKIEGDDPARIARELEDIRRLRTGRYHVAWRISKYALFAVITVSAVHMAGVLLNVLNSCTGPCAAFFGPDWFGNVDSR
jgi:hypothetical protein